jgi:hypothetical protein
MTVAQLRHLICEAIDMDTPPEPDRSQIVGLLDRVRALRLPELAKAIDDAASDGQGSWHPSLSDYDVRLLDRITSSLMNASNTVEHFNF